jgi:hypothetical protein
VIFGMRKGWEYILLKTVKIMGEPVVKALEGGFLISPNLRFKRVLMESGIMLILASYRSDSGSCGRFCSRCIESH